METHIASGPGSVLLETTSIVQPKQIIKRTRLPPIITHGFQHPLPPVQVPCEAASQSDISQSDLIPSKYTQRLSANRISFIKDFFFVLFGMLLTGIPLAVIVTYYLLEGSCTVATTTTTINIITTTAVTTTASWTLPSQCSSYTTINDSSRSILAGVGSYCDNTLVTGWYRFIGNGTKLATTHVSRDTCTTWFGGHYNGTMPSTPGTTNYGTFCINSDGYLCYAAGSGQPIIVTHCDTFFVYYLQRVLSCNSRYCTTN